MIKKIQQLVSGGGSSSDVKARCEQIKTQIENNNFDYDKEKLQERLAKLSGGVAVINVGGSTEVEVKEKDRVDDALNATIAAVEEGIVPGGGTALLYSKKSLEGLKGSNADQNAGIDIIRAALEQPTRQIVENAGVEGSIVIGKLLESKEANYGFDAQTETYTDLVKSGIIDPVKVVRTALENAASIAGLLLTTEAMVADKPEPKEPMPPNPGGMGGMVEWVWAEWISKPNHSISLNQLIKPSKQIAGL